jgi:hypothetical protein
MNHPRKLIRSVACQTWIEGTFTHEFTQSPASPLPHDGARIVIDLISIFRFDEDGGWPRNTCTPITAASSGS